MLTYKRIFLCLILSLVVTLLIFPKHSLWATAPAYCNLGTENYASGFQTSDFDQMENISISSNKLVLNTGFEAIDTENIVIPTTQEVYCDFIYEGASASHSFVWFFNDELTDSDSDGTPDDSDGDGIPDDLDVDGAGGIPTWLLNNLHGIFELCDDDTDTDEDNNIPVSLGFDDVCSTYDHAPDYDHDHDGTNCESTDYQAYLGEIEGGREIVFALIVFYNQTYDGSTKGINTYFSKTAYNQDTAAPDSTIATINLSTWLPAGAQDLFGSDADDRYNYSLPNENKDVVASSNGRMQHMFVGAPSDHPEEWILGWEDLWEGGDKDYEDLVFRLERKTGGIVQSEVVSSVDIQNNDMTITTVTFSKTDNVPSGATITYYLSIDGGTTWVELEFPTGEDTVTVDFSDIDMAGDQLMWRAMITSPDSATIPEISSISIDYEALAHGFYTHASPIPLANMVYIGGYETPESTWIDTRYRGHLYSYLYYKYQAGSFVTVDPPEQKWAAGSVLNSTSPDARTIYTILSGSRVSFDTTNFASPKTNLGLSEDNIINGEMVEDFDNDDDVDDNDGKWLVEWFRGYSG